MLRDSSITNLEGEIEKELINHPAKGNPKTSQ
jgi:hypothetical protein